MKTTIDIPEEALAEVIRHTGAKTKREAVLIAIADFNRRKRLERLVARAGKSMDFMTREDLRRTRAEP